MISCVLALLCALFLLGADQISKCCIAANFELGESIDFIKGLFNITYVQNRGVAWGMLSGKTWFILILTVAVMMIFIAVMVKVVKKSRLLFWAGCLILSGGIGNIIDRVARRGVVVDFIQFDFWQDFPVFNIADCTIVIGGALLIVYFIADTLKEYKQKNGKDEPQRVNDEDN